jgi:tRNA threonylcarbamoyladenosine biosynthesis protein TsaB
LNILVIDTSTEIEFIALSVNGRIFEFSQNAGISHSVTMFQNLSALLSRASISINDIDLFGVGIGPGSFTGIRIAVSTARMFAQILGIPLVGLKSQEIYAVSTVVPEDKTIIAAFDAKKSKVFAGVYHIIDSITQEIIEPGDYTMKELLDSIKNPRELLCIGDGCGKYISIIEEYAADKNISYEYLENFAPAGKAVVDLALRKYKESPEEFTDFNSTVPFYTRKSDAEIAKENR